MEHSPNTDRLTERTVVFGAAGSLLGVITDPPDGVAPEPVAVIVLNAGLLHRVGPNRLNVQFARRLAQSGFRTLRFDFSGLGDSPVRRDKLPFEQVALQETIEAMDYLGSAFGIGQFLLMGLCSGADAAFRVAVEDKRVTGAALIDFHYQPTTGYYLECYGKLMLNYRSWLRLFRGKSDVWGPLTSVFGRLRRAKKLDEVHSGADTDKILENFGLLGERGVKLLMVFSGRSAADYHYRRTFARRGGAVHEQVVVIDDTDHVFTRLSKQRALVAGVDDWVRSTLKQQRAAPECATIRP